LPESFGTDKYPPAKRRCAEESRDHAVFLVENGLTLVDSSQRISFTAFTKPAILCREQNLGVLSRSVVLLKFLSIWFWDLLVQVVNRNLTAKNTADTRRNHTTKHELFRWYGLMILIENTWGNDKKALHKQFSDLKANLFQSFGLGYDRFRYILRAIIPSVDEIKTLCKFVSDACISLTTYVNVVVIDESMIWYKPSRLSKERDISSGKALEKSRLAGEGPIHETYKSCFNFVEMLDSRWYSVEEHHHYQHWEIKMILTLMRFAVINSWTYHKMALARDGPNGVWQLHLSSSIPHQKYSSSDFLSSLKRSPHLLGISQRYATFTH